MRFSPTALQGLWVIDQERIQDDRGFFSRTFCKQQFNAQGLALDFVQASTAFTENEGTVRGLHFQRHPNWETKLVRCTRGAAFVVAVDLRPDSTTCRQWFGVELNSQNGRSLYVPEGFAQGYQTLANETELLYQMTKFYHPESSSGYSFEDPAFGIAWPLSPRNVSVRDRAWEPYSK